MRFLKAVVLIATLSLASLTLANAAVAEPLAKVIAPSVIKGIYASRDLAESRKSLFIASPSQITNFLTQQFLSSNSSNRSGPRIITETGFDTFIYPTELALSAAAKAKSTAKPLPEKCHVTPKVKAFQTCTYGPRKPTYRIALTGDSHVLQYQGPIMRLAKKYRWSVTFVAKSGCPFMDSARYPIGMGNATCKWWNIQRENYFNKHSHFDLVINSNSSFLTHNHVNLSESYFSAVKKVTDLTTTFLLIRDNPKGITGVENCQKNKRKLHAGLCDNTKANALLPLDELPAAVATNDRVIVADLTDAFCDDTTCFAYRSGKKVYRDSSHISDNWALHLKSHLDAFIPDKFKHPPTA